MHPSIAGIGTVNVGVGGSVGGCVVEDVDHVSRMSVGKGFGGVKVGGAGTVGLGGHGFSKLVGFGVDVGSGGMVGIAVKYGVYEDGFGIS